MSRLALDGQRENQHRSLVSVGPVGGSSLPTEQPVSCKTGVTRSRVLSRLARKQERSGWWFGEEAMVAWEGFQSDCW